MPEDENVVLEEAVDNLHEAAQRSRAVAHLMRSTGITEDPNYHYLAHRVASALAMTVAAGMEARRKLGR